MKRNEEGVVLVERDGGSSVVWFLIGGALGAGLALLFAPHSGDHTRRLMGRRLNKLRDAADQALVDLKEAISPEERVHRSSAETEGDEEDELGAPGVSEAKQALDSEEPPRRRGVAGARRELEQRLAEARARRHKAPADEDEEPVA